MTQTINFNDSVTKALQALSFDTLTDIQKDAIPFLLERQNVIMKAATGTGKTHAFLLPILNNINVELKETQAIIFAPTRELAHQLEAVARETIKAMEEDITVFSLIGGKDRTRSVENLNNTNPQILIGTPGRIEDVLKNEQVLNLSHVQYAVLDETDMIVENGFLEALDFVFSALPENVTFAVASATVSQEIEIFLRKYIQNIKLIEVKMAKTGHHNLEHYFIEITGRNRQEKLLELMGALNPYLAVIFCSSINEVNSVHAFLQEQGEKVGIIHGNMKSRERNQMLRRIHNLDFRYIVASDIAARGLDIEGVSHVINLGFPNEENLEYFFHRSGRTGRMNLQGTVITLFEKDDQHLINKLTSRGLVYKNAAVRNGELVEIKERKRPQKKEVDEELLQVSKAAKHLANKNRRVKPGYKKKINYEVNQAIRKKKRERTREERRKSKGKR